ncbi:hypothetical protein ACVKS2_001611 [Pseudomonas sp. PvP125]
MPAKRGKKNAQFGLEGKIGSEWRRYGNRTSSKHWRSNVGGGLLPMAVCQLNIGWLSHCYRGQAPSHIVSRRFLDQTRIEVPVISTGFSIPISISMVGATSASTPP